MVTNDKQKLYIEFSQRLNVACDDLGWPSSGRGNRTVKLIDRLPDELKVSRTAANKWFNGEGMPESVKIGRISNILGVAQEWLTTGEGPKYVISLKTEHIESKAEVYQPNLTQTPPKWLKSLTEKVENLNYTPTDNDIAAISGYLEVKANESRREGIIKMDKQKMTDFQYAMQMVVTGPLADMKYTEEEIKQGLREIYLEDHPDETITPDDEEYISMLAKSASS